VLTVRGNRRAVNRFAETFELRQLPRAEVVEADIDVREGAGRLVEVVVPDGSRFVGETVREANLAAYHNAAVLAMRTGGEIITEDIRDRAVAVGDTLLIQVRERDLRYLVENGDVVVIEGVGLDEPPAERTRTELSPKTPLAVLILAGVILTAALGLLPIVIAALAGVVLMFATDVVSPSDAYGAVSWNVIFLLAGVIPLGTALARSGGAAFLAGLIVDAAGLLPPLAVLALFYVLTGLLANVLTPVATVVLVAPVAVDTAARLGANGFAFLLAVLFAASTAFMTPIGYQTNLMVYGPGGYRFTDFIRVGAPLQAILTVVTTVGIALLWGL
jgi:di/tricarboxylate transporter